MNLAAMSSEPHHGIVVKRCAERREAELYALVLSARGMSSVIFHEAGGYCLTVSSEDAEQATDEITAYNSENHDQSIQGKRLRSTLPNTEFLLSYWAILLFFFAAARNNAFSIDWLAVGSGQTGLIRAGDWWRLVTALFLHESGLHLLSNLAFGTLFLLLLSQVLGPGMTALAVIAGGAAGNALDILVRPASHTVIGASTAIFAGIGLLSALRYKWRPDRHQRRRFRRPRRRRAPAARRIARRPRNASARYGQGHHARHRPRQKWHHRPRRARAMARRCGTAWDAAMASTTRVASRPGPPTRTGFRWRRQERANPLRRSFSSRVPSKSHRIQTPSSGTVGHRPCRQEGPGTFAAGMAAARPDSRSGSLPAPSWMAAQCPA